MANSLYKVHELMVKAGVELEEVDKKHIESIAEKAGDLLSKGMVKAAGASFDEIGDILNKKLKEAGKEPIVFSNIKIDNKTLDNMVSMFADKISSGIADSIKDGIKEGFDKAKGSVSAIDFGMDEQLKQLKADRQKLIDEYEKTKKLLKNKTKINDINKVLGENKELTLTGDLKYHTDSYVKQFEDATAKMKAATKGTKEYESAVLDAQIALDKLGAIQSEWHNKRQELKDTEAKYRKVLSGPLTKESTKKELELKAKIDQLKSLNIDKQIVQLSNLKMSDDAQAVLVAFGEISDTFDEVSCKLEQIETQIQALNTQIAELENNNGTLKALEQIEKAYDRILKKRGKVNKESLESEVGYEEGMSLTKLANRYRKSERAGEDWEKQYVWLVKFVEEYEKVSQQGKKINDEHRKLYNDLQPKYSNASKSLDGLFNRGVGAEQVGEKGDVQDYSPELAKASEKEIEAKNDVAKAAEEEAKVRMAIVKELAKYGTLKEAMSAGGKKIDFNGETVHFGSMVSDYMDKVLGQSFSREAYEKLWKEARAEFGPKFEPVEITKEDAIAIIREKVPDNILDGWFRDGDSSYKAKLEQLAMSDDDIRNAALNIMWSNFKEFSGKDIGFAEFLQSEISMYRGKNQENYVDGDETIALTFDRKVAEGFGKYVLETLVKPIETIGAYQTTGESEALVYRDKLEGKSEYQQWHAEMKGIANETDSVAEEQEQVRKEAEAIAKAEKDAADEIERQKRSLDKIGDTYKKNILPGVTKEISAQLDSKSGDFNRLVIGDATQVEDHNNFVTDYDSFTGKYKEHYDTDYHTHPTDVAAPSMKDLARYQQNSNSGYQQLAVIQAMKEALFLDFSSLNSTAMKEMVAEYESKSAQIQQEFLAKYGEDKDPTSENNQNLAVALKNAFLEVVQKYPGVAAYVDHEIPRYDSYYDRYEELPEDARQLIKEISVLYSEPDDDKKDWNAIDEKEAKLASLDAGMGRAVGTEQWIDLTDRISAEMAARQENIDSIQKETTSRNELSKSTESKIPSEDDIKGGKASWRGVPIQYDSALSGEARNLTDFMKVGPKFFGMDEDAQKSILDHEVAHNIADRIMSQATDEWEKVADIFAPKKQLPNGANPSFYTEEDAEGNRWYREGLYGDLGATALSETLTHALTEYFSNPDAFKKRDEGAFNYLEEYLNKSGDNLDNAAVDAVKEELAAQEELNAAKQEEQRIEQEKAAAIAESSLDKLDELSDKAYDETDADALNKILQERKTILDSIDESVRPDYAEEIESHQQINAELEKRLALLQDAKNGLIDVDDIDDIIKETGTLESKLERLDDVSYDWGMKIKDGEEDDAIDELEAFEAMYDRIILKLANGRNIEILPNAKGLRALNKYQDGLDHSAYGETEIDDVIFERKKKEIAVQEELNDAKKEEQHIEQASDTVVAENQKKIESYEELCEVVQQYNALMHKHNAGKATKEDGEALHKLQDRIDSTRGYGLLDDPYKESLAYFATFNRVVGTTTVDKLARYLGIEIPQAADAAKQEVNELAASIEKVQQVEQKPSSEVSELNAETTAQAELNEELKETVDLKNKIAAASEGGTHGQSLADISGTTGSADATVGANMQDLQNVLSAITYNVKIINDDTDKTANKIALDDSTLEATLNRVFANIINPATEQNDGNVKEPWALESTLQTVKGVLDTIQTNTAKIGTSQQPTTTSAQQFDVNDVGNTLKFIENAVNSIKNSIGNKTKTSKAEAGKPEIKNAKELGNVKATKVDTRVKELQGLYEQRGKLLAQQSFEPSQEIQEEINQLNKKIQLKFKELNIEEAKRNALKQSLMVRQDDAKQSEKSLLIARKADRARLQAAKDEKAARAQAARDEKAELKARMKRDREENRVGASTTAWNSGSKTLESLWKIDEKDKPLEQKSVQDLMAALKELNTVRQRVNENLRKGNEISETDSAELAEKTKQVARHTEAVKQLVKNYAELSGPNAKETDHVFSGGDLETHLKNVAKEFTNGQAKIGDFDAATGRLKYTVKTGAYTFEEYEMAVREAGGATVALQKGTKRTETFLEGFKRKLSEITRYFSASSLIFKFFNEFKKGIQYVKEIDAALVELRKVTDETEEEYDEFLNTASKTADRLGSTISAVTEATATFAKLGYTMEMASEMAEAAIVYKNVGDNIASTEDAADSIISTLKGFGLEASESMRIVDRFNEVGNKFAITSQGLGEALRLSASALNEGGNTLDESIGIITAANEVVNDPSSVGTALKTLTLRLRGSKTE